MTQETLPGGAKRVYNYGEYRVWRKDHPIIYPSATSFQFAYFAHRGVVSNQIQMEDGKTWQWNYTRYNNPSVGPTETCSSSTYLNCNDHAALVIVAGPYDPNNPAVQASETWYTFNATLASVGVPG